MSKEGTMLVLAFTAKQNGLFKASDVYEETGLERPLVYYHLGRFVEKGYLEKQGSTYCVRDRESLVEAIAFGKASRKKEVKSTLIWPNGKAMRTTVNQIVAARAMSLPGSRDCKDQLNLAIDDTIESLRNAKKLLNTSSLRQRKATKTFDEDSYREVIKYLEVNVDNEMLRLALDALSTQKQ